MAKKLLEQRAALEAKMARLRDEEEKLAARGRDVAARAMLAAAKADPEAAKAVLGMLTRHVKKMGDRQAVQPLIEELMALVSKHGSSPRPVQEVVFSPVLTEAFPTQNG
jgi:hypothetical protein